MTLIALPARFAALSRVFALVATLALPACGGGGGSADAGSTGQASVGAGTQANASAASVAPVPQPGDLLAQEPAGATWAANLARLELLRYYTQDVQGRLAPATALLMVPKGLPPTGGWPVVAWAHGTKGVADQCAPSRNPEDLERMLAVTGMGYVVVAPDYEGLGVDGPHPYLDLASAARSVVYAVRAARKRVPEAGVRWAAMGHSQGGHATLGAAEQAASLAPELQLVGAVTFAPASHFMTIANWYKARIDDWDSSIGTFQRALPIAVNKNGLVGLVAAGIKAVEPDFAYTRMLGADMLGLMPRIESQCPDTFANEILEDLMQTIRPGRGIAEFKTYAPGWESDPAVLRFMMRNEPGSRPTAAPVLVLQGDDDMVVPRVAGDQLNTSLCTAGSRVDYRVFAQQDHVSIVGFGFPQAQTWLQDRFAGKAAGNTCGQAVAVR